MSRSLVSVLSIMTYWENGIGGHLRKRPRHFWPVSYTVVRTGRDQGVIVEEEKLEAPDSDDIASFVKILEGDFYFSVRFFIGRYYGAGERLRLHYRREQQYCQIGRRYLPRLSTLTAETVFPAMLTEESREKLSALLHEEAVLAVSERTGAEAYDSDFY